MRDKVQRSSNRDYITSALAVFGLLLTIYLLTFNGRFSSIDGLAIYARAESLVQQGSFDTPQLVFSNYHNRVGEIEAGFPILAAPFYWLAQQVGHFNNIHVVMLLNPLLTAVTGTALYLTARTLGYSHRASVVAALAFGLTTLAWPYSRTLYREPLVGLGWSLGLYGLVSWRYRNRSHWFLIGGLFLVLTLVVKITAVVALPFIFLAAFARTKNRQPLSRLVAALVFITVIVGVLFLIGFTLRFGVTPDLSAFSTWSPLTGLRRVYGQLLSPGAGLIFYMPAVILTIPGLVIMYRQHQRVALAISLPLLATAVAYSFYNSWFGGQSWGPRFLVAAVPLVMLAVAPLWDAAKKRWQRGGYLAILALSFVIQLGVVTANWWGGYRPLFLTGPRAEENAGLQLDSISLSPPLVQLQVWGRDVIDLLWYHPFRRVEPPFSPWLALGLVVSILIAVAVWRLNRNRRLPTYTLLLPPTLSVAFLLLLGPAAIPAYRGLTLEQSKELAAWAATENNEPFTLVTASNEFHIFHYLGFLKGDFVHHWYSTSQTEGFEPILEQTLGREVRLIVDRAHVDTTYSGKELEWWLNGQLFRVESDWVGNYELVRYAILPADSWNWQDVDYQFGDSFTVTGIAVSQTSARPRDIVGLQLNICRSGPAPEIHKLFTHLQQSTVQISGHDGPIRYGGTLVIPWEEGDCLVERRAIEISTNAQPGTYDIIAGFETPDGLLPVQVDGMAQGEITMLGQVTVNP